MLNQNVTGQISSPGDVDWFEVGKAAPTNEDLLVVLRNDSEGTADLEVKVYNQSGMTEFTGIALSGGAAGKEPNRVTGQQVLVRAQEPGGRLHPVPGVNRAADDKRIIPAPNATR